MGAGALCAGAAVHPEESGQVRVQEHPGSGAAASHQAAPLLGRHSVAGQALPLNDAGPGKGLCVFDARL